MAKNKGTRIIITLRCTECQKTNSNKVTSTTKSSKKIDYTTTKNRRNTPNRLELKKFCPNCNTHTKQKEIK
uniref:50S ribosomal protein L33 n=1 Tax=Cutleria multifida TaxID=74475 RepID=UPI002E7A852A|nr:50S ribosomal protein L33 [Cutleria multifida]WAM62622.1 50S ribosomal protein L33 [Cutleria multifida]